MDAHVIKSCVSLYLFFVSRASEKGAKMGQMSPSILKTIAASPLLDKCFHYSHL